MVTKQLKKEFPHWKGLPRKEKRSLAKQVLESVAKDYSYDKEIAVPLNELTGTPAIKKEEIMTVAEMGRFIAEHDRSFLHFPTARRKQYIKDPELIAIHELLDNHILDRLLAPKGYTPSMRLLYPSHLLRAELLKSLKYPELSYRKYCPTQLNNLAQKENRAFVGLPLHKKVSISHSPVPRTPKIGAN